MKEQTNTPETVIGSDVDVCVDSISKRYMKLVGEGRGNALLGKLGARSQVKEIFWAVRDVSFSVRHGEALGVIGANGAGKSTLLKILSRITAPTSGSISVRGRLSALLEVGSGFHPELTGRENVYLSGSILGMTRREIQQKLDAIVAFAGVSSFIDMPVKRYSSGMYVRLGFSIAAHLEPDVLLLDEVLAVGDASFQKKCADRVNRMKHGGKTIIFISHDLAAVERICDRVLVMSGGQISYQGSPADAIAAYRETANASAVVSGPTDAAKSIQVTAIEIASTQGSKGGFNTDDPLLAKMYFVAYEDLDDCQFHLLIRGADGRLFCALTTRITCPALSVSAGPASIEFYCDRLLLRPGVYSVDGMIERATDQATLDYLSAGALIDVHNGPPLGGEYYNPYTWELKGDHGQTGSLRNRM